MNVNKFGMKNELFQKYRNRLMKEKRDMELEIIRENKRHEVTNSVCDLVIKYEDMREKAEKRTSRVINRYY